MEHFTRDEPITEELTLDSIWDMSFPKIQNVISRKLAQSAANHIFPSDNDVEPTFGAAIHAGMPREHMVKRIQALANSNSTASAWINANPMYYMLRMSDVSFSTAWKLRNLKDVVNTELWCRCGQVKMDSLTQHLYICSNKHIYSKVRGGLHNKLKHNVKMLSAEILAERGYKTDANEPKMRMFYRVIKENAEPVPSRIPAEAFRNKMSNDRRADICVYSTAQRKNLLVDVTTASPLAHNIINNSFYRAGMAADQAVKNKISSYKKFFNINDTRHSSLWFFAVDTNGCLSKEARDYCKLLANLSGKPGALQYIYQRVSVAFQNSLVVQVFRAIHHYTSVIPDPLPHEPDPEPEVPLARR